MDCCVVVFGERYLFGVVNVAGEILELREVLGRLISCYTWLWWSFEEMRVLGSVLFESLMRGR